MEYFESDKLMQCNPQDPNVDKYRIDYATYQEHIQGQWTSI